MDVKLESHCLAPTPDVGQPPVMPRRGSSPFFQRFPSGAQLWQLHPSLAVLVQVHALADIGADVVISDSCLCMIHVEYEWESKQGWRGECHWHAFVTRVSL